MEKKSFDKYQLEILNEYAEKGFDVSYIRNPNIRARTMMIYCVLMSQYGITPSALEQRGVLPGKFFSSRHSENVIQRLAVMFINNKNIANLVDLPLPSDVYEIVLDTANDGFDFGNFFDRCSLSLVNASMINVLYSKNKIDPSILEYINDDQSDERVKLILNAVSDNIPVDKISNIFYSDVQAQVIFNFIKANIDFNGFDGVYISDVRLIQDYDEFRKKHPEYNLGKVFPKNFFPDNLTNIFGWGK